MEGPYRIVVGRESLVLGDGVKLYRADPFGGWDKSGPIAEALPHPHDPNIWGLKNVSNQRWRVSGAGEWDQSVDPGQILTLTEGATVNFGGFEGYVTKRETVVSPALNLKGALEVIFIVDCSGAMAVDGKIQALNFAAHELLGQLRFGAEHRPDLDVSVSAVRYSDEAQWMIEKPLPAGDIAWEDVAADGLGNLGKALGLITRRFRSSGGHERAQPVLVLLSNGWVSDDLDAALGDFLSTPLGRRSVRLSVVIGPNSNPEMLAKFMSHPGLDKPVSLEQAPSCIWGAVPWAHPRTHPGEKPELRLIFLIESSGWMAEGVMSAVNQAMRQALLELRSGEVRHLPCRILIQCIKFSTRAQWHVDCPSDPENLVWVDILADGEIAMGEAFLLLADSFKAPTLEHLCFPAVLLLVSGGAATDNFRKGLNQLNSTSAGSSAVRVAVGLGKYAELSLLQRFVGGEEALPRTIPVVDSYRDLSSVLNGTIRTAINLSLARGASRRAVPT